jgi:hypothetical protein
MGGVCAKRNLLVIPAQEELLPAAAVAFLAASGFSRLDN